MTRPSIGGGSVGWQGLRERVAAFRDSGRTRSGSRAGISAVLALLPLAILGCHEPPITSHTSDPVVHGPASPEARAAAEGLHREGLAHYQRGEYDEAFRYYQAAIARDPTYAAVYVDLGKFYYQRQLLDEEIRAYRAALERDPTLLDAHLNLAHALFGRVERQEQFGEPEEQYRWVLDHDSSHPQALYNLALILEATSRSEEALSLFRRYATAHPDGRLIRGAEQHVRELEHRLGLAQQN